MEILLGQGGEHQDGVVRINYKSDFPLEVRLMKNGEAESFPDNVDFTFTAKTEGSLATFKAECKNGVYTHCKRLNDQLIVFFDNHKLGRGPLKVSVTLLYPDANYSDDGIRQETYTTETNIELVDYNEDALKLQLPSDNKELIDYTKNKIAEITQEIVDTAKRINKGDKGEKGEDGRIALVNHGTADTTFTLTPNTMHVWGEVENLNLSLAPNTEQHILAEYCFQFTSLPDKATTLSISGVSWYDGYIPAIKTGKTYQGSILNGIIILGEA